MHLYKQIKTNKNIKKKYYPDSIINSIEFQYKQYKYKLN